MCTPCCRRCVLLCLLVLLGLSVPASTCRFISIVTCPRSKVPEGTSQSPFEPGPLSLSLSPPPSWTHKAARVLHSALSTLCILQSAVCNPRHVKKKTNHRPHRRLEYDLAAPCYALLLPCPPVCSILGYIHYLQYSIIRQVATWDGCARRIGQARRKLTDLSQSERPETSTSTCSCTL